MDRVDGMERVERVERIPKIGLKVLVCGGRDFANRAFLERVLDVLRTRFEIGLVITGGARGADTLAAEWAVKHGLALVVVKPDWSIGKHAGVVRNQKMLDDHQPHVVVAFPGGNGTADMVRRARALGRIQVLVFDRDDRNDREES